MREARLSQRAVALVREGSELIDTAREQSSAAHLTEVQAELSKFLGRLDNEDQERIAGLPDRIRASLVDVDRRLQDLRDRDEKQQLELAERKRFQEFLHLRSRAQLAAVEFELDPASRRSRLGAAARRALSVYARDPQAADDDWALADRLPGSLSPAEKGRITEGCYDLLLMLSQAIEPAMGLKMLDRAEPAPARDRRRPTISAGPIACKGPAIETARPARRRWPKSGPRRCAGSFPDRPRTDGAPPLDRGDRLARRLGAA